MPPSETGDSGVRHPHVVMDLPSRQWKARKIEAVLGLDQIPGPIRMLEVGAGGGGISHYFGTHPTGRFRVDAVDVVDNRLIDAGYEFTLVSDTHLPFDDESFDIVLSNHVIEHVGAKVQQQEHVAELRRVMRRGGRGYLAVPNRWMPREPHYGLLFLSWLPHSWRSPYLRLAGKGDFYDCEPLQMGELEAFLRNAGFVFKNRGVDALRATFNIERPDRPETALLRRLPDAILTPFERIIPTHIYTFAPAESHV